MCDGMHYAKDSVHQLSEQDALNFGDTVAQVSVEGSSITGVVDAALDSEKKVAPAHPNKMLNSKKTTKK